MKTLFKKILLLALFVVCSIFTAQAQYVAIPDANFRAFLQTQYPQCFNAQGLMDTTCTAVVMATTLDCSNRNIASLEGVQYFDGLDTLSFHDNFLSSLPVLPSTLQKLNCSFNLLTNLGVLPVTLQFLICNNNQLTSLPNMSATLKTLKCDNNQLINLPVLPPTLQYLDCSLNQLVILPVLPATLQVLYCNNNQLPTLPFLPTTLERLGCSTNPLSNLPALPVALQFLTCGNNQLMSLPTLPATLQALFCFNNQLTNLPALPAALQNLNCGSNQLTSLPALPAALQTLECYNNQLTSLPSLPAALQTLQCFDNPLICLPFLPSSLTHLHCSPAITCLPNRPNNLQTFYYQNNTQTQVTIPLCTPNNLNGCLFFAHIFGKTCIDNNNNCTIETADSIRKNILVRAIDNATQQVYVGTSNAQGDYEIAVPIGTFSVSVLPPSNYWTACGAAQTVVITQDGQQEQRDMLLKPEIPCASMEIDHQAGIMRPCSTATLTMTYFNKGTITSAGTYADLELPAELTFVSASLPVTPLGNNHFSINIGDVAALERSNFTVNVTVNCSVVMNQMLCTHIEILPNTYCNTNTSAAWDGSDVSLSGRCVGNNQVRFVVANTGNSPMTTTQNYYIVEDDVMVRTSAFQLPAGASDSVTISADPHRVYRIIATETPNIPAQNTEETFLIWGCNGSNTGIHWGFVNQYALNTGDVHEHDLCTAVRTSFDPNDISAVAEGVSAAHFIPKNSDLEYKIRFQNTGNDTAFVVRILDKIPAELDLTTLRVGSASHPMTYSLKANGTLEFLFQNILLEDSTSNEPKSHGFVTYKIKTKANIVTGTTIANQAFIYFDANAPVATNIYTHTIAENRSTIFITAIENQKNQDAKVRIMPNPMHDVAVFKIETSNNENFAHTKPILTVYNMIGQVVKTQNFDNNTLVLQRNDLPDGCYLYKISNNDVEIAKGKLVVQ
jgi:Leucine-rich repeat (LRR) protein